MNKISFLKAESVLSRDAAPVFACPLVEERLNPVHHGLAVLQCRACEGPQADED